MRFVRRRFGHYDLIDFVVVLLGYAISGERTLETFYERMQPFATTFMALFGRDRLPARSTLSRFLAALDRAPVEALRTVFLEDLLARPLEKEEQVGGLWDRQGTPSLVFDLDGTRQAAHQRALPCTPDLPPAGRRLDKVCAPGYLGRKRGEVVRTRTTILQAHTHQWVGTFSGTSGAGNGDYRGELQQVVKAISAYAQAQSVPLSQAVVRLDGQYGNGAIVADLAGLAYIMRGKDYDLLNLQKVQARLAQPPDQQTTHPETGTCRALFDCPDLRLSPTGPRTRVIVATHPATATAPPIGTMRGEVVYELFFTALPVDAFTPADVVALYLHRGAFEAVRASEDQEQDPDRWCSHTAWGQEFWLILAQWIWNLRLELDMRCIPRLCVRRNLLPPRWVSLPRLRLILSLDHLNPLPSSTDRHSGHAHRIPKDLPEQISVCYPMGHCAAQQSAPSMRKSGDRSAMARYGCSMQRGSAIVARVRSASSVKNPRPPARRDGSVPSIGLSLHAPRSQGSPLQHQRNPHLHRFLIRCSGETGSVAPIGGSW